MGSVGRKIVDGIVGLTIGLAVAVLGTALPLSAFAVRLVTADDAPLLLAILLLFGAAPMVLAGILTIYTSIRYGWRQGLHRALQTVWHTIGPLLVGLPLPLLLFRWVGNHEIGTTDEYGNLAAPQYLMWVIVLWGAVGVLYYSISRIIGWAVAPSWMKKEDASTDQSSQ